MKRQDVAILLVLGALIWIIGTIHYAIQGPTVLETTSLHYWTAFIISPIVSAVLCIAILRWRHIAAAHWASAMLLLAIPGMIGESVVLFPSIHLHAEAACRLWRQIRGVSVRHVWARTGFGRGDHAQGDPLARRFSQVFLPPRELAASRLRNLSQGAVSMGTLLQDLRYGARTLRKSPGFTLVAVIALALGIGANTAMFSIVNGVLLRSMPYAEPDRLLRLYTSMPQFKDASVSYPNFLDWQQRNRSFEQMAAYRNDTFNLTGQANPERLRGYMASFTIFSVLGVKPIVGRTFSSDEDQKGAAPVVVLTSSFWKARFGGDPGVIGRTITLDEKLYSIIGVVPDDDVVVQRVSIIIPIGQWSEPLFWDRSVGMGMRVVGR